MLPAVGRWHEAGARLFPLAVAAAAKGDLVPPAQAEALLAMPELEAVDEACHALQRWCWLRGMPPLDRVVAHARTGDPFRIVCDYEPFYAAMGVDVAKEGIVLAYPWRKVREPSPEELALAGAHAVASGAQVAAFRRLDLELDLLEADAARGRRRPIPEGWLDWEAVRRAHGMALVDLGRAGLRLADLRPPGKAPYPPPRPRPSGYDA